MACYQIFLPLLSSYKKPTYIIEGEFGNASSVFDFQDLLIAKPNSNIYTALVTGADHFSVIHPINTLFASAIRQGDIHLQSINIKTEIVPAYVTYVRKKREITDLRILTDLRSKGHLLEGDKRVQSYFYAYKKEYLSAVVTQAKAQGISFTEVSQHKSNDGNIYFMTTLSKIIPVASLNALFALSRTFNELAIENNIFYDYWTIDNQNK
jgi:hypothetical protein